MLTRISLGTVGLVVGTVLTIVGFVAYGTGNATLNIIGFFYGFFCLLGGLALKTSELKPVPMTPASPAVLALREQQATATQNQIRKDVTRYRYGQDVHLDRALALLELSPTDQERPNLVALGEAEVEGSYALALEFESPLIPLETWQGKQERIEKYFGPGIRAKLSQPAEDQVEVVLIAQPEISKVSSA